LPAPHKDAVRCLLDECLPATVAEALALVGHPIISVRGLGKSGVGDEELIPWMGREKFIWITRDDAARRQHGGPLRAAQLSVVWVRGTERSKSGLTLVQLHLLLTNKLPEIVNRVEKSRIPLWFLLYLKASGQPVLQATPAFERLPGEPRRRGIS
jgi:predicted nuclease of predicted toxin-antitoxin system